LIFKKEFLDLQKKTETGEEESIIGEFFRDMDEKDEYDFYVFGVKEVEYGLKNGLVKKLLLHKDIERGMFQKVIEAKKMQAKELLPKEVEGIELENVVVVGSSSDRGLKLEKEYDGVCGRLFFKMNVQDLMEDEQQEKERKAEEEETMKGEEEEKEEKEEEKKRKEGRS